MHMAWVRAVCGRLKSDYRSSASIVYNNFPWPESIDKQRANIETAAQGVLDAKSEFQSATLSDLYDPLAMPAGLLKAHQVLDRAVDSAYGKTAWKSESERVVFLFGLYEKVTTMFATAKAARKRRRVAS